MQTNSEAEINTLPLWAKYKSEMKVGFPSPYNEGVDSLASGIYDAIKALDQLKHNSIDEPAYLGKNPELKIDFNTIKNIQVPAKMSTTKEVVNSVVQLFEGLPNWGPSLNVV